MQKKVIKYLRSFYYLFHRLIYLRLLRNNLVFVDLDFTLFDNYKLIKNFPNENFYSLNIEINNVVKKELDQYKVKNIYLFTARGVVNSHKTIKQLSKLGFDRYNKILFFGTLESKFSFLKMNDIFFRKKIILYDDFQDYDFEKFVLIKKTPPSLIYTKHIDPLTLNTKK